MGDVGPIDRKVTRKKKREIRKGRRIQRKQEKAEITRERRRIKKEQALQRSQEKIEREYNRYFVLCKECETDNRIDSNQCLECGVELITVQSEVGMHPSIQVLYMLFSVFFLIAVLIDTLLFRLGNWDIDEPGVDWAIAREVTIKKSIFWKQEINPDLHFNGFGGEIYPNEFLGIVILLFPITLVLMLPNLNELSYEGKRTINIDLSPYEKLMTFKFNVKIFKLLMIVLPNLIFLVLLMKFYIYGFPASECLKEITPLFFGDTFCHTADVTTANSNSNIISWYLTKIALNLIFMSLWLVIGSSDSRKRVVAFALIYPVYYLYCREYISGTL